MSTSTWYDEGPQYLFIVVLVIGIILALIIKNPIISYSLIFLVGAISGKSFYKRNNMRSFLLVMVVVGFFIGFALADTQTNWKLLLLLYVVGGAIAFNLYKREILR